MSYRTACYATAVALCGSLLISCASQSTTTPTAVIAPTAAQVTVAPDITALPAATSAPTTAPQPTIAASPIPAPTTVEPFPLAAGWWDSAVCYEVFVRSFVDSDGNGIGDFNGLISKLDYISDGNPNTTTDLGANCIWLMPIAEATSYHGYDTVDYYNIEQDYGTNDDFKRFVEEAHKRDIKIIIDLVINHTSIEHPWFQEALRDPTSPYRDYFIWSAQDPGYRGPWGDVAWHKSPVNDEYYYGVFWSGMPDLNFKNPAVTAEAQKISSFWRKDMGVDGFRLDAIKHLIEDGQVQENTPETHAWLQGYRAYLEQNDPGTFTVGEIFNATPVILKDYFPNQLDSYFIFDLSERILTAANQGTGKIYANAAQRVNESLPFQRYAPFLTNHDQDRAMSRLGGDVGKAQVAAVALLTLPGMPFIYYGEEIGMTGVKGNPPKVDEPLRSPMQWTADATGFTSGTPWQPFQADASTIYVAAQEAEQNSLLNQYRKLIHLHTSTPALAQGDLASLTASVSDVAAYVRNTADDAALVIINFDPQVVEEVTYKLEQSTLAPGTYTLLPVFGATPDFAAPLTLTVEENGTIADFSLFSLAPKSGYIFTMRKTQ